MTIRKKILLYFSVVPTFILGFALLFIYTLFLKYREKEFRQEQREKIVFTVKFLSTIKKNDENFIETLDRITINKLYDEKLLVFDDSKKLVYSSIDDTPVPLANKILHALSPQRLYIEGNDGLYDEVGIVVNFENKIYYGISKGYDFSGYSKLHYLRYELIITFITISLVLILISIFLSRKITYSIFHITRQIRDFDFTKKNEPIIVSGSKDEITLLVNRFNELMKRMNDAFLFQKHAIHHISHELKTPISILVSNFERMESETDSIRIKELIQQQKEDTKRLSEIINALLEIAKAESGTIQAEENFRIDELIYDLTDDISLINPSFQFSIEYNLQNEDEKQLTVSANRRLLKAAISNLMINCVQYSSDEKAKIIIDSELNNIKLHVINNGGTLSLSEEQYLFQHFFRGENSHGKRGFGLGLVFVHKILSLHKGEIFYSASYNLNTFTIVLPLS